MAFLATFLQCIVLGLVIIANSEVRELLDKAPRLSIRIVIWILPSDTVLLIQYLSTQYKYQQILRRQCYLVNSPVYQNLFSQCHNVLVYASFPNVTHQTVVTQTVKQTKV